jgi:hypothetical protein
MVLLVETKGLALEELDEIFDGETVCILATTKESLQSQ